MASKYIILDTNILSDAQKPRPRPELIAWLEGLSPSKVAIPYSALFEISYGIELVSQTDPERANKLRNWHAHFLSLDFAMPETTPEVGEIVARMACKGPLKDHWIMWPDVKRRSAAETEVWKRSDDRCNRDRASDADCDPEREGLLADRPLLSATGHLRPAEHGVDRGSAFWLDLRARPTARGRDERSRQNAEHRSGNTDLQDNQAPGVRDILSVRPPLGRCRFHMPP
ncbi:putative nucleic acid-binding protein [Rhizobium mongolense]